MTDTSQWVRITRTFDAPAQSIWDMWTNPKLFQQWYGPNGMSIPVAEMDVRVGGTRKVCMEMVTPDRRMGMWFIGVYKEVTPVTRLVYTESMSDPDGNILSPAAMGMPAGTPDVTEVIVTLKENGKTTEMTMVHVGIPAGSPGAGGWGQAFDKLAKALAQRG